MPIPRKVPSDLVPQIRADYEARRNARAAIIEAKRILNETPDAMNWARSLNVSQCAVLNVATGRTYREVV